MDNLYYFLFTNLIILVSFISFIVLITVHIVKKKKPKAITYLILFLCITGMYLFIPSRYLYLGYAFQSPDLIQKAIKSSINPYEKRLCYSYMADIYNYDISHEGIKNGNLAIEYFEKALNGEYSKYPLETEQLAILYSIKGDYDKTIELNKALNRQQSLSLKNIYIMKDEYNNALNTFRDDDKSIGNFLKADLYKKTGNIEKAKEAKITAEQIYESQLSGYKEKSKQIEYIEKAEKYKSVEAYKEWLKEQAKEYKFQ